MVPHRTSHPVRCPLHCRPISSRSVRCTDLEEIGRQWSGQRTGCEVRWGTITKVKTLFQERFQWEERRGEMAEVDEEQRRKKKKTTKVSGGKERIGGRWPAIKPKKDLQLNRLKGTHLFTLQNFLSAGEAKGFVEVAESLGFVHQGSLGPSKGEAFRDNHRISVNDPELARRIWESGLNRIFEDIKIRGKIAAGLNPNIRFYRYSVGQKFGRHIDESVSIEGGLRTYYTLLIYLSGRGNSKDASLDSLVGGETVFYDMGHVVAEVAPVEGTALLHIHGDKCMLHEARVVSKNVKYVLRSDVAFA